MKKMFGLGFFEILFVLILALVVVGPKRLPHLMREVAKFFAQTKAVVEETKSTFDEMVLEAEESNASVGDDVELKG